MTEGFGACSGEQTLPPLLSLLPLLEPAAPPPPPPPAVPSPFELAPLQLVPVDSLVGVVGAQADVVLEVAGQRVAVGEVEVAQVVAPWQPCTAAPLLELQPSAAPWSRCAAGSDGTGPGRISAGSSRRCGDEWPGAVAVSERKARNRAKQARFRERPKAKSEQLFAAHAAAAAELRMARQERQGLEAASRLLQQVLTVRDAMLASLGAAADDAGEAGLKGESAAAAGHERQEQQQPPPSSPRSSGGHGAATPGAISAAAEQQDTDGCEALATAGSPALGSWGSWTSQELPALLQARPDLAASAQQATAEGLLTEWRELGLAAKEALAAGGQQAEAERQRLLRGLQDWTARLLLILHLKPECMPALLATNAGAPDGLWKAAAASLAPQAAAASLAPPTEQPSALGQLWVAYTARMQALGEAHAAAAQELHQAATGGAALLGCSLGYAIFVPSRGQMGRLTELCEAAARLGNLRSAQAAALLHLLTRVREVVSCPR
ncbi:hypothetical protein ABPG75_009993 [Micractinium tetrahymenae]